MGNFLFLSILMLNFLITVFSETHERVLANSINFTYETRAKLNVEVLAMLKTFNLITDIDYMVVCSKMNEDVDDEVEILGVITSLTTVIQEYSMKIGKQMIGFNDETQTKIEQVEAKIEAKIEQVEAKIEAKIDEVKAQVDRILEILGHKKNQE